MKLEGSENLIKAFESSLKNYDKEVDKTIDRIGNKLLRKVKLKTPVDQGTLRRSWRYIPSGNGEGIIENSIHYASHVEYGHRKRGGKGLVEGRYMLTKSVKEIEDELEKDFAIMIENLWK